MLVAMAGFLQAPRAVSGAGNAAVKFLLRALIRTVVRVFENGNMEAAGRVALTLNNGNEYVHVRGVCVLRMSRRLILCLQTVLTHKLDTPDQANSPILQNKGG